MPAESVAVDLHSGRAGVFHKGCDCAEVHVAFVVYHRCIFHGVSGRDDVKVVVGEAVYHSFAVVVACEDTCAEEEARMGTPVEISFQVGIAVEIFIVGQVLRLLDGVG